MGEENDDPNRVIILGAGLAGLTAAYNLKKSQVPFLLVEGNSRVGGRAYSINDFNSASQVAELGGEWILPGQDAIIQLAKELKIDLVERTWSSQDFALVRDGRVSDHKKLVAEFRTLNKGLQQTRNEIFGRGALFLTAFNADEIPKAHALDQQTAEEYLKSLKISSEIRSIYSQSLEVHYGVSPQQLSALSVFSLIQRSSAHFPGVEKSYRLSGGTSSLVQALLDRVMGVIPRRFLQTNSSLIEVDVHDDLYELKFQTPTGVKIITSKSVVCTLPISILRQVRGFYKLSFPDPVMKALQNLQYGSTAKGAISFGDRPWKKNLNLTRWWSANSGMTFTESEPRMDRPALTPMAVLSFQVGSEAGAAAGLHTLDSAMKELSGMKMDSFVKESGQIFNWRKSHWSQGSGSFWGPGAASQSAGVLSDSGKPWIFAGEHTSTLSQGTMNGAIESAQLATHKILQNRAKTT
jgi:monoamine oxidase